MGEAVKKITANIPAKLLDRAQQVSGLGITETLIAGLEELERSQKRSALRMLRGKVRIALDLGQNPAMILIDTSAWIDFFRGRDPAASSVDEALANNEAALCGPIVAELRRGLLNDRERNKVIPLLDACHLLAQPAQLWTEAGDLGFALRRHGLTPKTLDLLIATYALSHSATLLTTDRDFRLMQKAGVPLQLATR